MTPNKNNAFIVRRDLLIRICKSLLDNNPEGIDRIPLEMKPKNNGSWRCCVYKDRAVLKYKLMALMGFKETDEVDELVPVSAYSHNPKGQQNFIIDVVSEACSHCPSSKYMVSNFCQACDARPCQVNCPKDAIGFSTGKALIDSDKCVNCGKCAKECPYQAIHYLGRPCENSCPVQAIYQDEDGKECIDPDKCILCGKCLQACPFGAIIPSSQLMEIIHEMQKNTPLVAVVAPSIAGQFREDIHKIYGSVLAAGFSDVIPVAAGADLTAKYEAEELDKILTGTEKKGPLLSSCCPAWVNLVQKHLPQSRQLISDTPTPLAFTVDIAKEKHPEARVVFIAPCIAKREEVMHLDNCDYCISFEELGALLVASGIEISDQDPYVPEAVASDSAHGFAMAGGVASAITGRLQQACKTEYVHNLDKSNIRKIKQLIKSHGCDFLEVMSCDGGCMGGNLSLVSVKEGVRIMAKQKINAKESKPALT